MRGKPAILTSTAAVPQVSKRDDATFDPAKLLQVTREEDNDERSVMKLLEKGGIDLEYKDETGRTALSLAAEKGKETAVRRLIELGAVIDSKDQTGRTPLSWAAAKGHLEIVRHLMEAESYKAFDKAFREASGNAGSHDVVEVGSPGDADLQALCSKLNTALHQPYCAHKVRQTENRESSDQHFQDLRSQHLCRVNMHREVYSRCGFAGLFAAESEPSRNFGWANFSFGTASICFAHESDTKELRGAIWRSVAQQLNEAVCGLVSGATYLQQSGFCCNQFTVLTATQHETDTPVVRMNTIPFDRLMRLQESIAALQHEGMSGSSSSQSVSASIDILYSLFDINLPFLTTTTTTPTGLKLHYCSLVVQLLCLGLISFSRAHVEGLHPINSVSAIEGLNATEEPLNEVFLCGSSPEQAHIVIVERSELACMGEMVGGKVSVFRMASDIHSAKPRSDKPGLPRTNESSAQLSATCEEIVESWGPGSLLFADAGAPSEERILGLVLRGGIIQMHRRLSNADHLFHWGDELVKTNPVSAETFSYRKPIIVGAAVESDAAVTETATSHEDGRHPIKAVWDGVGESAEMELIQVAQQHPETYGSIFTNKACCRKPEQTWKASYQSVELLGSGRAAWRFVERSLVLQFGDKVLGQVGGTQTLQPGVPAKQAILNRWTNEGKLSLFEELHGLQVSLCTGVAQRVPLRVLVRDNLMNYVRSLRIPNWERLEKQASKAMASRAAFTKWESELTSESRACVVEVFDKLLKRLKDTGFDKNGVELAVLWPHKSEADFCVKIPPDGEQGWCKMLKDREWSTTFAVATNWCLEAPSFKCRETESLWGGMNMLSTFIYPSLSGMIPSNKKKCPEDGWQIRHRRWYWNGETNGTGAFFARKVSDQAAELKFFSHWLRVIPRQFWSRLSSFDVLVEAPSVDFSSEEVFVVSKSMIGNTGIA